MAAIDIGAPATNRISTFSNLTTWLSLNNPANDTGIIDTIEIWSYNNLTGCKVGTFVPGAGTNYALRSFAVIGNVTGGSKQVFTGLSISVVAGDLIGIYFITGLGERTTSGFSGLMLAAGDMFSPGWNPYTLYSGDAMSVYGIGETPGWAGVLMGKTNPAAVMGKDKTSISTIMGK